MLHSITKTFQYLKVNGNFNILSSFWCISMVILICQAGVARGMSSKNKESEFSSKLSSFSKDEDSEDDISIERSNSSSSGFSSAISIIPESSHAGKIEVLPGCFVGSSDLEMPSKVSSDSILPGYLQPIFSNWKKITRSTMGTSKYRRVTAANYLYTRRLDKLTEPPFTEPKIITKQTPRLLTKQEHLKKMKELYDKYVLNRQNYGPWRHIALGPGFHHFGKLDIRVGRISQASIHPKSIKLYICLVDIGTGEPIPVVVTLGKNIQISTLILRRVVLVANIKPSIILGYMSKAKIITTVDVAEVTPIYPPEGSEPGDVVIARGFPREPLPVLEPKARIYQTVSGLFKTNNESIVCYQRIPWEVEGKGFVNIYHFPNVLVR